MFKPAATHTLTATSPGFCLRYRFVFDSDGNCQIFDNRDHQSNPLPRDRLYMKSYDAPGMPVCRSEGPKGLDQYGKTFDQEEARKIAKKLQDGLAWCNSVSWG